MTNKQTRLNVNINEHTLRALHDYAEKHGVTVTEALRRLVGIGHIITQATTNKDVLLRNNNGNAERITFVF